MSDTSIQKWDSELEKYAKEAVESEDIGGSFISFAGAQISVAGELMKGAKINAIILGSIHENVYYEGAYDSKNRKPPVCFAFSKDGENMKPHADSAKPQAESCAVCPHNKWVEGKAKACKNTRRLALIAAPSTPEDVPGADVFFARLPVTSVKNWSIYVKALGATHRRPAFSVITEVSNHPDPRSQFKVKFNLVAPLDGAYQSVIMSKCAEVQSSIDFPYRKPVEEKPSAQAGSKKY